VNKVRTAQIQLPPKLIPILSPPLGSVRYRAMHGGRGGAKSFSVSLMAAVWGYQESLRILCVREFQNSIKESLHAEIKNAIESYPWLQNHYDVGVDYLRGRNGTEFIFKGIRNNSQAIKSLSQIDLTIVEEAENVPEQGWLDLEATIFRKEKSELIALWNPNKENSPVDNRFIKNPPSNALITDVQWYDNPWFPPALNELRLREQQRLDPNTYAHIWEGAYLKHSKSQVFYNKFEIKEFDEPKGVPFYCGVDYGFSQDPAAAIKAFIQDDCLYISYEAYGVGIETDDLANFINAKIPDFSKYSSYGDSSRPETTSYLKRHGLPLIENVKKWKGSVEDGISFMKSFKKIYIHPRCTNTIQEFKLYSYKVDRLTGDILPEIVDAHNHGIDSIRYAIGKLILNTHAGILDVL
jgi:phage terminase large subunit